MNIVFLDFDGVINTPKTYDVDGSFREELNTPKDKKVNNYSSIKLLNRLCKQEKLDIVVDSKNWRNTNQKDENGEYILLPYKQILYDSGLDEYIYIYGHTPSTNFNRDMEIKIFLEKHKEVEKFILLDANPNELSQELRQFAVICSKEKGFTEKEYGRAIYLLHNQPKINRGNSYME